MQLSDVKGNEKSVISSPSWQIYMPCILLLKKKWKWRQFWEMDDNWNSLVTNILQNSLSVLQKKKSHRWL